MPPRRSQPGRNQIGRKPAKPKTGNRFELRVTDPTAKRPTGLLRSPFGFIIALIILIVVAYRLGYLPPEITEQIHNAVTSLLSHQ